jgi:hypothetical protein
MLETPLAFDFSKTRTVCVAFDDAWAFLQSVGSDLTEPSKSLASRTILAKRIIEMADQGLMGVTELRDDALAFVQHIHPPADRVWRRAANLPDRAVRVAKPNAGISACGADASLRPTRSGGRWHW